MINNRQAGRRRGRGGGGGGGQRQGGNPGRPDTGNRIDSRARGNANQLYEKYKNLARDAQMSGDRVNTEYYLQFADHYFRVLNENRSRFEEQQGRRQRDDNYVNGIDEAGFDNDEEFGFEGEPIRSGEQGDAGRRDDSRRQEPRAQEARRGRDDGRRDAPAREVAASAAPVTEVTVEHAPESLAPIAAAAPLGERGAAPVDAAAEPRRRGRPRRERPAAEEPVAIDADRLPPSLAGVAEQEGEEAPAKPRRRRTRAANDGGEVSAAS